MFHAYIVFEDRWVVKHFHNHFRRISTDIDDTRRQVLNLEVELVDLAKHLLNLEREVVCPNVAK
ncbi:MAG: hypothetical protein GY861_21585 [bacterium]|nr:hypothetical protein [bacterium]